MVDMMEFGEIVMSRYATKKFDGRKIPETKVNELLEMVRFSPSAINLQPWKIKVVTDQKVKELLKPVFCADPDYESLIARLGILLKKSGAPEEIQKMVIGMAVQFTQAISPDQKLAWSQAQTYLALGNALNGAKSLGFDSCPMGGFDPKEVSRILKIPLPLVPVMLCPLGYAADKPLPKVRFAKEDIIF